MPYYKSKATHALFTRAASNKDVPSGSQDASSFSSEGPNCVRNITAAPEGNEGGAFCYIMNAPLVAGQCSEAQLTGLADGTAVVKDFVVVG